MEMPHLAIISRIVLTSLSVPGLKPAWAPLWWKIHQYLAAIIEAIIIKTHCKFSEGIHMIAVNLSLSISICHYHHISTPLIIVIIVLASVPEKYWLFQQINTFNYLVLRRWLMSQATLHWQRWRRKRSFQHSCCQHHGGYFDSQHDYPSLGQFQDIRELICYQLMYFNYCSWTKTILKAKSWLPEGAESGHTGSKFGMELNIWPSAPEKPF